MIEEFDWSNDWRSPVTLGESGQIMAEISATLKFYRRSKIPLELSSLLEDRKLEAIWIILVRWERLRAALRNIAIIVGGGGIEAENDFEKGLMSIQDQIRPLLLQAGMIEDDVYPEWPEEEDQL